MEDSLLTLANQHGWQLDAWAVFSNHYHFVGHSAPGSDSLKNLISHLRSDTAREINLLDREPGRTVWHNFWDTRLTFERSYLARLNYVHQNPVRHGLVSVANRYPFCSAAWFERTATPAQVKTIYGFKIDRINVPDEYEPEGI